MEEVTLKSRAVVFALCVGLIAFVLSLLATSHGLIHGLSPASAIIPAIVCGVMSWASAERAIASTAGAIDAAIARLASAAAGDLDSEIPPEIGRDVPQLGAAMEMLFSQLGATLDQVQHLAMYDPVTRLPNRASFRAAAQAALADLPAGAGAALFFLDLDRFKLVNDTMGHAHGDALLAAVAERLRGLADHNAVEGAGSPLIGRLAGDEFTILLPGIADSVSAMRVGRAMLQVLVEPFRLEGQLVDISASIGVSLCPRHGTGLSELMRLADAAMYHAKGQGRGCVELFSDSLAAAQDARATLDRELRSAIEEQQFLLVFQPQVAAASGEPVVVEALLRWRHPRDGMRSPASFIQRAEESGLIVEIGEWIVGMVAETLARWGRNGVTQRLAVNVSQRQLDHVGFFRRLRAAMKAAGAPAALLELEISETFAMACSREALDALAALRADGATIAIDDFGTGYSNIARLRELPVDRVKLDPSVIEQVASRAEARTIAHALIGLIHGLGCEAVAEGVESQAQADVLRVIGCDALQGYAIAPPMDEAALIAWSRERDRRLVS
ncbi:MAG: putative bifunctional diguanylate cyclase/phosphodiesterase [Sphingomonas sp.]